MDTVLLCLPEVKQEPEARATACRYCGCTALQGWGHYRKPVRDSQVAEIDVARYRCTGCGRTFRHYPEGVSRGGGPKRAAGGN